MSTPTTENRPQHTIYGHLLIVGIGPGMYRSLLAIKQLGIRISVVNDVLNPRIEDAADSIAVADPRNMASVLQAVEQLDLTDVDGIMTLGIDNPLVIAVLSRVYGCPGLTEEVAYASTNKDKRIELLKHHGLNVPEFRTVDSRNCTRRAITEIGLPVVLKPVDLTNSVGVLKIVGLECVDDLIEVVMNLSPAKHLVVEKFLTGSEHTVTGFSVKGNVHFVGFSDRDYSSKEAFPPYFFERGDIAPTHLSREMVDNVHRVVRQGISALSLWPAFFNADVLVSEEGDIYLIELTGRLTGARIATEVVPLSNGIDPIPNLVRLAMGKDLELAELVPCRNDAVVQRYLPCNGGVVEWVGDIDEVFRPPGVYDLFWNMDIKKGMQLPWFSSNEDTIAGVIVVGANHQQAASLADYMLANVPIRIRKPEMAMC